MSLSNGAGHVSNGNSGNGEAMNDDQQGAFDANLYSRQLLVNLLN